MRSRTVHLPAGSFPRELLRSAAADAGRAPDFVLSFLPPGDGLAGTLASLAETWPATLRFGCEAVTRPAGSQGSLQLFWLDVPGHRIEVEVVPGSAEEPPSRKAVEALARRISGAGGALLIADGLLFPAERFLGELREALRGEEPSLIAGGLAAQEAPPVRSGAHVFCQDRLLPAACLIVLLHGVSMRVEVENAVLRNLLAQATRADEDKPGELFSEQELAQVTLGSIGDGVLATDAAGRIEYLNTAAENLTGWERSEALGRPLAEVFHLIDESPSHQEAGSLVRRSLAEGKRVRLTERITLERRDGRRYAIECTCAPIRHVDGRIVGAAIVFQDVSDKRLMALQLAHQATHDDLTGLFNRQAFDGHLQRALAESRDQYHTHALFYMDLDQFKLVNDTSGHLAGDELLCRVAALLQESVRETDLVARLGGDEFAVLMPRCTLAEAQRRVTSFHRDLQAYRFTWRDRSFQIGASIGLVLITAEFKSVAHLLSAADHACYVAKEKGRDRIQVYREDDAAFIRRQGEMNWVLRIQETLEEDRFCLFSQSIQALSASASRGLYFEVLLRLLEADGRIHLPNDFLRAAERYGLMRSIDRWVIRESIQTLMDQPGPFLDLLSSCSINLSAASVSDESFLDFVEEEISRSRVPPQKICFEITETAAIENLPQAQKLIARLSARGVRFALDDFGTGMSSYGYLRDLAVSYLKIDAKFVKDIVTDPLDRAMVESINQVGHVMGLLTVAEGVPSLAAVEHLRTLGVDYAQGNWISPPRPLTDVCVSGAQLGLRVKV